MRRSFLAEVLPRVETDAGRADYRRGVPADRPGPPPSLRKAIERDRADGALLVEYKRASPGGRSPLPPPRSVSEFVEATASAPVAGYSCLATAYGFEGSPGAVAELVSRTRRPVLFKEFLLRRSQIEVAARTGAAAVLLIARLTGARQLEAPLESLAEEAHARGLEVLLELHDPAELSRMDGVRADVVGVNTRDLDTLRLERDVAYRTLDRAAEAGIHPLLGLSGVEGPADAAAFWSRGCDGLLVGTGVARAGQPGPWLTSLRRRAEG